MTSSGRPSVLIPSDAHQRFELSRWFAFVALATITALATLAGFFLNHFMADRMVRQEAVLTQEFINSLLLVETPLIDFLVDPSRRREAEMSESFEHLSRMPDVLRANLYDARRRLTWSSDAHLIGRELGHNAELAQALSGELVAMRQDHADAAEGKGEHHRLPGRDANFIEIYVPVRAPATGEVIGAIEFYKRPQALARVLSELRLYLALSSVVGGALLFLALNGLVRRADRTIRAQEQLLIEQAKLAALGEMSAAVAHGIRNPLASIRSSAELMRESPPDAARAAAHDIILQADRLETWVRELLAYSQPLDAVAARVPLAPLVHACLADFERDFERRRIRARHQIEQDLPPVRADAVLLAQVMRTLLANAIEALSVGGRISVRGQLRGGTNGTVLLEVLDDGPGLTPHELARVGQPFYSTKPAGLGIGLAMARRIIERAGGRLEIESAPGAGTAVRLYLARA